MKVLLITYYWPPAGGPGVQRWLYFVKYLRDFGIEPIVYTAENPAYPVIDKTLCSEVLKDITVLKQPIWEPPQSVSKGLRTSFLGKIASYIRANFFIPDARCFWIKPSVRYLSAYLQKNPVDAIITTGPPHSMHLIGLGLKKDSNIPWIADFRDPWVAFFQQDKLPLTKRSKKKHEALETLVVQTADTVIAIGETLRASFLKYNDNVVVITNGFDGKIVEGAILSEKFTICHTGAIDATQNPENLWRILGELIASNPDFSAVLAIHLIGSIAPEVQNSLERHNLLEHTTIHGYLPHKEVLQFQQTSQLLLLTLVNDTRFKGIVPGKIFEYLAASRPILAVGPVDGDLATLMNDTKSAPVIAFEDVSGLKKALLASFELYEQKALFSAAVNIEAYHRKRLTEQLAGVIKKPLL